MLLTLAILFIGEILPKTFGATKWKSVWHLIVLPLTVMEKLFAPLIYVSQAFASLFRTGGAGPAITEAEIQAMIQVGGKSGEITPAELQLLSAVFHFDDLVVRQIMVPRRSVVIFEPNNSLAECIAVAQRTKHTRYPVCRKSLDDAIGLAHIKDLLGVSPAEEFKLKSIVRPLHTVPETMPISRLLRQMQSTHQHMATVIDEFGTAVGVVTLENVLEQIVGAVQDEFDTEMPEIVPEGEGQYLVEGQLPIERINRELKLNLDDSEVDTISGLLVSRLGRLLRAGDTVQLKGAEAQVVEVQAGRATRIRLAPHNTPEEGDEDFLNEDSNDAADLRVAESRLASRSRYFRAIRSGGDSIRLQPSAGPKSSEPSVGSRSCESYLPIRRSGRQAFAGLDRRHLSSREVEQQFVLDRRPMSCS